MIQIDEAQRTSGSRLGQACKGMLHQRMPIAASGMGVYESGHT
jgi:hypothetical protein